MKWPTLIKIVQCTFLCFTCLPMRAYFKLELSIQRAEVNEHTIIFFYFNLVLLIL